MRQWRCQGRYQLLVKVSGCVLAGVVILLMTIASPTLADHISVARQRWQVSQAVGLASADMQIQRIARQTTVRLLTSNVSPSDLRIDNSGSGVIVQHQGQVYTVLTNWHVVGFSYRSRLLTADGRQHSPVARPRQLGSTDMAIVQFRTTKIYAIAPIAQNSPSVGDTVFSAGFPIYQGNTATTTFNQGVRGFRWTQGQVSLLPEKPLARGYALGYTNDVVAGMSGGPIFNTIGQVIGINGRLKNAPSGFGAYVFGDGSQPPADLLRQMAQASWGIPITTYLGFVP